MKKVLYTQDRELKSYIVDEDKDLHSEFGLVKNEDYAKDKILSNKGKEFFCVDASFIDLFNKLKRGAQVVLPKDIATILVESGINKSSFVLDAGTGSGALSAYLSMHVKKVYTFDNRAEHIEVAKRNYESLGIKNIVAEELDIYESSPKLKNIDLVTLDLTQPWKSIPQVEKCMKQGAFLIAYNPQITQAQELVNSIEENPKFITIRVLENIQREWDIRGKVVRPKFAKIAHTGFIVVARRIR